MLKEDAREVAKTAQKIETIPRGLKIGSGNDFRHDRVTFDITEDWGPYDWGPYIVTNLAHKDLIDSRHQCDQFGDAHLRERMFDRMIFKDVIEHIPDLVSAMTHCLVLLASGEKMQPLVPYDLSFDAWQDPIHLRAVKRRSWVYYTDGFRYLCWNEARFHVQKMDFNLSPIGQKPVEQKMPMDELIPTPCADYSMFVIVEKPLLNANDKAILKKFTSRSRDVR